VADRFVAFAASSGVDGVDGVLRFLLVGSIRDANIRMMQPN
jgi:hypothetical protein